MRRLAIMLCIAALIGCGGDDENNGNNGTSANNASTGNNGTSGQNSTTGANVSTNNGMPNSTTGNNSLAGLEFRTESPEEYTRVDAVGQPLIAVMFVAEDQRNAYNDAIPNTGDFDAAIDATIGDWHSVADDELEAFALPPCSMPTCLTQDIGDGITPADLLRPDALQVFDTSAAAGYPNGRMPADPVHDIMLSVLLLDQSVASPDTLVGVLNPPTNDYGDGTFPAEFPYLNPPHEP